MAAADAMWSFVDETRKPCPRGRVTAMPVRETCWCETTPRTLTLIDFGFWGEAPLGFDLAQLLLAEVQMGERPAERAGRPGATLPPGVRRGSARRGLHRRTRQLIRRAHALVMLLFSGYSAIPFEHLDRRPTAELHRIAGSGPRVRASSSTWSTRPRWAVRPLKPLRPRGKLGPADSGSPRRRSERRCAAGSRRHRSRYGATARSTACAHGVRARVSDRANHRPGREQAAQQLGLVGVLPGARHLVLAGVDETGGLDQPGQHQRLGQGEGVGQDLRRRRAAGARPQPDAPPRRSIRGAPR